MSVSSTSAAKARVLVVDDDVSTRETFIAILRLAGYEAEGASTGREALALIESEQRSFHLLLVDLRLPDMSGLEVLASVCESSPDVPVVMVSAWGTDTCARAAKQLGAVDFLEKPIVDVALVEAVERHLSRSGRSPSRRQPAPEQPRVGYAATRWATLVVPITRVRADVPTLADWSRVVGRSRSTVKTWCHAAGVQACDSLDFARALRIVLQYESSPCNWFDHLAIVDPRTLTRFLEHGGLQNDGMVPGLATFLQRQRFVTDPRLPSAVETLLDERST